MLRRPDHAQCGCRRDVAYRSRHTCVTPGAPVALAKQLATLATFAGPDRLVVGVGAGWLIEEFVSVGIDPAERFARLDEHVAVMRAAWQGISEHDGTFYSHPPAGFHPVPNQPIPILVGGSGPITLQRIARWADGWAMPNVDPGPDARSQYVEFLERLDRACDTEGRNRADLRLVTGAPLAAPSGHYEMLSELGIDDVDVMLDLVDQLDLVDVARFAHDVIPKFR
ncbi:MAG: LLM class flavin-dependent oxidoreductase [Actinomycetota bacterium]|nr:LLM class flavin-dependent oxidoreductase [Actinomycetota bacterium]